MVSSRSQALLALAHYAKQGRRGGGGGDRDSNTATALSMADIWSQPLGTATPSSAPPTSITLRHAHLASVWHRHAG